MSGPGRSVNPPAARHPGSPPPVSKMTGDWATVTRELAAGLPRPPISVVILTYNEADNVGPCIDSCAWSDDIHVLDSGSTDNTQAIARERGASVHENPFESFGQQRNWAIDNIETTHDWQLQLDADERCTAGMVEEMHRRLPTDELDAFRCPSMLVFMDRWLRHASE
ncbi:MAG: glycosyltransferase family 2 protein, partial [Planctomycetota bacterium]